MLRHSDSSTEDASLKDHDRPLTAWGRTQASELCRNLIDRGWANPDLVLCSASQRSRETLRELAKVHHSIEDAETHFLGSLYHFAAMDGVTAEHLRETIVERAAEPELGEVGVGDGDALAERRVPAIVPGVPGREAPVRTVMCIGHNKGWEEAASDFTGTQVRLGVANAALLECDSAGVTTWRQAFAKGAQVGWRVVAVVQNGLEGQEPPPELPQPVPLFGEGGGPTPMPSM